MALHIAACLKILNIARLQDLARQTLINIKCNRVSLDDVKIFKQVYNGGSEYNGWNTKVARETGKTPGTKSNVTFYPLIDMS